jgi:hypothetical protein
MTLRSTPVTMNGSPLGFAALLRERWEEIPSESDCADCHKNHSPGDEENPSQIEDKYLSQVHDIFPLGRTAGARSGRIPIPRRD